MKKIDNYQAWAYMELALIRLGYSRDQIDKIQGEIWYLFDAFSVDEIEDIVKDKR